MNKLNGEKCQITLSNAEFRMVALEMDLREYVLRKSSDYHAPYGWARLTR